MLRQPTDRLAAIEQDLRSRRAPLADILRGCRDLAKDTQAVHLEEWAMAELEGYWPFTAATGAKAFFCDPYSSWQKGSVEHANKLLRAYLPKGCDLGMYDQAYVDACVARLNKKPRKILGYKSALQLAIEKGVLTSRAGGALRGEFPA